MYERAKKFIRNQRIENNKLIREATTGITPKTSKMVFDMSNTDDVYAVDTNKRAYIKAIELVSSLLNSFHLPSRPALEYHGMIKNASDNSGIITDGIVKIGATIRTLMGHNIRINVPVIIKKKSLIEPAVFFYDNAPYVLCGTALDELIRRGSLEKSVLQRRMYSPPIDNPTHQDDLPKEGIIYHQNMFSPGFRNPMMFRRQYNKTAQVELQEPDKDSDRLSPYASQACGFCGYTLDKKDMTCPNCGSPRKANKVAQEYIDPDLAEIDPDLNVWDDTKIKERMEDPEEKDPDLRELVTKTEPDESTSYINELKQKIEHMHTILNMAYSDANKEEFKKILKGLYKELRDAKDKNKLMFASKTAQHKGEPRDRINIDTPVEPVEIFKDDLKDEMLDPAERCYGDYIGIGTKVKLKEDYEARDRGGSTIIIPKGQSGKVIKTEGDGKMLYVTFDGMGISTYVPMRMFKSSNLKKKIAQSNDGPDYVLNTFMRTTAATVDQVKNEIKNMIREGYQKIDIIDSINRKYPEQADEALDNIG